MDNNSADAIIQECRKEIDQLDDQILALFAKRCEFVARVGEVKKNLPGTQCFIRPGREASMVRRVVKQGAGKLPRQTIASMWRMLISGSILIEQNVSVAAYAPDACPDYFWLSREYFGPFTPVRKHPAINRVLGDVMEGDSTIGLLPMPHEAAAENWWVTLAQGGEDWPRIFACVPFLHSGRGNKQTVPSAIAIAKLKPEKTGNDVSLVAVKADANTSRGRLSEGFTRYGLEASCLATEEALDKRQDTRWHLFEIPEFVSPDYESMKSYVSDMGSNILQLRVLGAYAAPLKIS
ncbi:MAG: chorismate mutase [Alphaproteobacteria bacterium]|nr:chorismate mutase [Alphaproteobacteria bacterium]